MRWFVVGCTLFLRLWIWCLIVYGIHYLSPATLSTFLGMDDF